MIVAKLAELLNEVPTSPRLQQALHFILENQSADLADGRYEIDGDKVYALVQSYTTLTMSDQSKYEAHQNYIDIQYIASGQEAMGWAPLEQMTVTKDYDPAKDVVLGTCPVEIATKVKVKSGEAAIFFPQDAHAPKLAVSEPCPVKKIVLKIAV